MFSDSGVSASRRGVSRELLCCVGSQYDKHGNLVDWWGNQSAEQFNDLAQCFVNEYNHFVIYGHHVCLSV